MLIGSLIGAVIVFGLMLYLYMSKSFELSEEVMTLKSLCRAYKDVEKSSKEIIKLQEELIENQKSIVDTQSEYIGQLEGLIKEIDEIAKGEKENESND